jgi:hypothetical protein
VLQRVRQLTQGRRADQCNNMYSYNQQRSPSPFSTSHYRTFNPLIRSFNPSTLLPNFSSSFFHPPTWASGLPFLDFHPFVLDIFEISTILGLSWKFVISLIRILDSVSRDWRVGVIGVEGGEVSLLDEFVGLRPGSSSSASCLGTMVGRDGIGARSLKSGYKWRDFNNEFSDLKYRIAERRFSTYHSAPSRPCQLQRNIPAQRAASSPILHP